MAVLDDSENDVRGRTFLSANWSGLLMAQWPVPQEMLVPYLGPGIEVDTFQGSAYVSLVGLRFSDTRMLGVGVPFHRTFTEVNLRFYVRREAPEGVRRGVVFISELVPRFWIAAVARTLYNEKYRAIPMRHSLEQRDGARCWTYGWRAGGSEHQVQAVAHGDPQPMIPGSREEFIAEHYWGYSKQRDGNVVEYRVRHPRWRVWSLESCSFDWSPHGTYGHEWGEVLRTEPEFVFVAEGSEVTVSWGRQI